ncbi:MAG: thioredoxin family protein [Croceimicrobium sp.]|nr:thioredoxin family protein [Bacteroidota bacterium]
MDLDISMETKSYNYQEYRALIDEERAQGKATGGNTSDDYLRYTDLNTNRMDKWDKRYELSEELKKNLDQLEQQEHWLLLTEGWCGDAAHSVPVIAKMADYSSKIKLDLLLRDENLELMDKHLTNGGRSIPKLIRYSEDGKVLGEWGPRPAAAQQIMLDGKAQGLEKADINVELQKWYARDRGASIDQEFQDLLK